MATTPQPTMLSVAEVARRLRVAERTVRSWAESGRLQGSKVGQRLWRFPEDAIEELLSTKFFSQPIPNDRIWPAPQKARFPLNAARNARSPQELLRRLQTLGFSMKEIANQLEVSQATMSRLLSGQIPVSNRLLVRLDDLERRLIAERFVDLLQHIRASDSLGPSNLAHTDGRSLLEHVIATLQGDRRDKATAGLVARLTERLFLVVVGEDIPQEQGIRIHDALEHLSALVSNK